MRSAILLKREGFTNRALLCLLVLWVVFGAGLVSAASERVGRVEWVQGLVQIEREGYSGPAKVGDDVYLHDAVQTREDSGVEIVFVDESRLKMAPNADLVITEYLYQPEQQSRNSLISMMSGKVRFLVQDLQDYKQKRFRVETQTAVVGTRGTDFIVSIESPESTKVFCNSNQVEVCSLSRQGGCVFLAANMITEVRVGKTPEPPRPPTPVEREQIFMKVTDIGPVSAPETKPEPPRKPPPLPEAPPPTINEVYTPTVSTPGQ